MGRCNRSGDVGEDEGEAMLYGERGRAGGGSTFIRTLLAGKSLPYPPKIYEGRQMPEFSHLAHHLSRNSMSKCSCPRFAAQQAAPPGTGDANDAAQVGLPTSVKTCFFFGDDVAAVPLHKRHTFGLENTRLLGSKPHSCFRGTLMTTKGSS